MQWEHLNVHNLQLFAPPPTQIFKDLVNICQAVWTVE